MNDISMSTAKIEQLSNKLAELKLLLEGFPQHPQLLAVSKKQNAQTSSTGLSYWTNSLWRKIFTRSAQ